MVMRFLAKLLLLVTLTRHGMPFAIIDVCTRVRGGASVAQTMTTGNQTSVSMSVNIGHPSIPDPSERKGPLKVLFLSADTGGGHRASAESLAKQFLLHYPGSSYDLLDVWTPCGVLPYRGLVNFYKHLSANPNQWKTLYHVSNTLPWEILTDIHSRATCGRGIRKLIESYDPDVVVSVHPAMNYVPMTATRRISKQKGKHIPFFTVVTDLGSAHTTWFQKRVDKLYVASERLYRLARRRGRTPKRSIARIGLPIRHDFAIQASMLGDRQTEKGKLYQQQIRASLDLPGGPPVVLIMGGGEGVGSLSDIVDETYASLVQRGIEATICVVCGRNEKLQQEIKTRDWSKVVADLDQDSRATRHRKRRKTKHSLSESKSVGTPGQVTVVGLGFVTNMAEYMVASDIVVTKAGPGTIAEAASLGLPVLMTSFLPGQEAGNVDYVLEKGFGEYCDDPVHIADQVAEWLQRPEKLVDMSAKALAVGRPEAASEIVQDIGSITHTWMAMNNVN